MSHFDHEESQDLNEDIDVFEQQLRSIRPQPASRSWSEVSQSMEPPQVDLPASVADHKPHAGRSQAVFSHSVTAAVSMALGAAIMLMVRADETSSPNAIPSSEVVLPAEVASQQLDQYPQSVVESEQAENNVASKKLLRRAQLDSGYAWRSRYVGQAIQRDGPLRVFGSWSPQLANDQSGHGRFGGDFNTDSRHDQSIDLGTDDHPSEQPQALPDARPPLSPRSLRPLLDELTQASASCHKMFKAKESQS